MSRFTRTARTVPARFNKIGSKIVGTVLELNDGAPVPYFENGRPVAPKFDLDGTMLTQTDVLLDVDGVRTLLHTNGGVEFAIAKVLEDSSTLDDLEVGDELTVEYVSDEDMGEGLTPAKVFAAKIKRPKK